MGPQGRCLRRMYVITALQHELVPSMLKVQVNTPLYRSHTPLHWPRGMHYPRSPPSSAHEQPLMRAPVLARRQRSSCLLALLRPCTHDTRRTPVPATAGA